MSKESSNSPPKRRRLRGLAPLTTPEALGYYPLLPNLLPDLPEVLAAIRGVGCVTALDAAGDGGELQPLRDILPHVDVYVPSRKEAEHQTGETDPRAMITAFRDAGAGGLGGGRPASASAISAEGASAHSVSRNCVST